MSFAMHIQTPAGEWRWADDPCGNNLTRLAVFSRSAAWDHWARRTL